MNKLIFAFILFLSITSMAFSALSGPGSWISLVAGTSNASGETFIPDIEYQTKSLLFILPSAI